MTHSKYQHQLEATASCTKRMVEARKGISQKYKKGIRMIVLFLTVYSTQISLQKLRWKMATA